MRTRSRRRSGSLWRQINLHPENDTISEQEVEFALDPIGDGELLEIFESWHDIMKVLWQQCKLEKIWILQCWFEVLLQFTQH